MADVYWNPGGAAGKFFDQSDLPDPDDTVVVAWDDYDIQVFLENESNMPGVMDFTFVPSSSTNSVINPNLTLMSGVHARFEGLDSTTLSGGQVVLAPMINSFDFYLGGGSTLEYVQPSASDLTEVRAVKVDMTPGNVNFIYTPSDAPPDSLTIFGMGPGSTIRVEGADSAKYFEGAEGEDGSVVFYGADDQPLAEFTLDNVPYPQNLQFNGGSVSYACYLKGTHIATPDGEVKIETLRAGDQVTTASGGVATVKWVGYRTLYRKSIPAAHAAKAFPILFKRDSIADNVPHRDLFLSPWHHVFFDGMLVPAFALINDKTIVQQREMTKFQYFHLELESFDILLAEGVPAESYVDTGNRSMFQNASTVALRANFEEPVGRQKIPGIRIVRKGAPVEALQKALAARADQLEAAAPEPEAIRRQA